MLTFEDLKKRYLNQGIPSEAAIKLLDTLIRKTLEMAKWMEDELPEGREKSIVHTKLEEVKLWAVEAIIRNM